MNPDDSYRDRIGLRITQTLADALERNAIDEASAKEVAGYVLDNIDNAKTSGEILDFLTNLAEKWPIFGNILTIELGHATEQKTDEALQKTQELIHENKLDEAMQTMKDAEEAEKGPVQNG